jgi:large exoprotein involved in heme utilization and adhesion
VTLGKYSLDVYTPTGAWASVLTMNLMDPNNAAVLKAFRANTKLSVDITHLVRDWPVDKIPPWNGIHFIVNTNAEALPSLGAGWVNLGYQAGWSQNNGDRTDTATWDYGQVVADLNANWSKVTYLDLQIVVNANSADYTGWVWFYMDNMRLSGGGIALKPAAGQRGQGRQRRHPAPLGRRRLRGLAQPVSGHLQRRRGHRQRGQRSERAVRHARRDQLRPQRPGVQHAVLLAGRRGQRRQPRQSVEGRRLELHDRQLPGCR